MKITVVHDIEPANRVACGDCSSIDEDGAYHAVCTVFHKQLEHLGYYPDPSDPSVMLHDENKRLPECVEAEDAESKGVHRNVGS